MNYRERFLNTLNHENVDRPPYDLCGTELTGLAPGVIKKLADYLKITAGDESEALEKIQKRLDIDFRVVGTVFSPESEHNSSSESRPGEFVDSWGITRKFTGTYWDISKYPLCDLSFDDIKQYKWPSVTGISKDEIYRLKEKAKRLYYDTDYVVVGGHPVFGYFELGCWMFSFDDFLYRMLGEPETVEWFFENYHQYVRDVIELYYGAIGEYIHVTTSGDDFGMQTGPFMSAELFGEAIVPWYKKRIKMTKEYTNAAYFHHTCGSVYRLLEQIIGMGVDVLNPVQPGCFEMEPERLKNEFGDKIVFWGAIDEQNILSHGTAQDVRKEVARVKKILNQNGGYVLAPSHNVQIDVPMENIAAMFE